MPRHTTTRTTGLVIKQIEARLMKISREVDKHIYKNKLIAESKAESYLQEMTPYMETCRHDLRTMQVLEKLINAMKTIIAEKRGYVKFNYENEVSDSSTPEYDNNTEENVTNVFHTQYHSLPSPVYSLADEDKGLTQFINKKGDKGYLNDTMELCCDVNDQLFNLNLAVSNMSLSNGHSVCDVDLPDSPSILNDIAKPIPSIGHSMDRKVDAIIKEIKEPQHIRKNVTVEGLLKPGFKTFEKIPNIVNNLWHHNKEPIDINKIVSSEKQDVKFKETENSFKRLKSTVPLRVEFFSKPIDTENLQTNYFKGADNSKEIMNLSIKNGKVTKPRKKRGPKKLDNNTIALDDLNKPKKARKRKNKNIDLTTVTDKITTIDSKNSNNTNVIPSATKVKNMKKTELSKSIKFKTASTATSNHAKDGLTWLNGIKYVREIDIQEYQDELYDDNFWFNSDFPTDLNADFII